MRFLADMGVSMSTVLALRLDGHDVIHLLEEGLTRLPDPEILGKARAEGRIVLTFDLDFGDLLVAGGYSLPSAVIFRLRNQTPASVTPKLLNLLRDRGKALVEGAVVIVADAGYRVRRLPI